MTKGFRLELLMLALLAVAGCKNEIGEAMEAETNVRLPDQVTYDAHISYSSGGKITTRLFSPEIRNYITKDSSHTRMDKGFRALFYDSLGNFESELTAKKGIWYETRKTMVGENQVVFKNNKGEVLNTEKLIWLQDSGIITTDLPIKIIRPDGIIYGRGLVAAEDFSSYTIQKITGELYVEENDTLAQDTLP